MNVLLLNYEYPPLGGGAGNATRFLLHEFSEYPDLQIDVVTSSQEKQSTKQLAKNIILHQLNIGKHGVNLQQQTTKDLLAYTIAAARFLPSLHPEKRFDLVHAFFAIPCGYLASRLHLPYIVSLRGSDVPNHNPKFKTSYLFFRPFIRRSLRQARIVVANSEDLKQEAFSFFKRRYEVIGNGVDSTFFKPAKKTSETFRVFTAGRLHGVKNIDLLIRGFSAFLATQPEHSSRLIVAGDGPEQERLHRLAETLGIKQSVQFLGHCSKETLRNEYQQCSVFALLSTNEGMSNTILEALACGAPILATNTGGVSTLVNDSNGYILNTHSVSAVSNALQYFFAQQKRHGELGARSRKKAEQYTWKKTADAYYRLYQNAIR